VYHQGTVRGLAVRAASLLAGAGLLGLAATAGASAATGAIPADYSCSLAAYGQGLAPLTIPAALSATQMGSGPAAVVIPQTLTLTPVGSASAGSASAGSASAGGAAPQAQQAPLTCTTSSTTTVQVTASAVAGIGAAGSAPGQAYTCTVTVGTATTTASRVPMVLTAPGPAIVGRPDMVMLSAPASTLGSAFPASASPMSVSGLAALGGTAGGSVPLTGLADAGNGMFRLTGPWMPRTAGMARIFAPHRFAARLREQTAVTVAVACTAVTATTATTQVMVQASATAAASPPAAAPGAPDTGGGGSLHPGGDLPLATGGAAAVLAGLGITLFTLRHRRGPAS